MIEYSNIDKYLTKNNFLDEGEEVSVYRLNDKVIKIFHLERVSSIEKISCEGLEKLITLNLKCFNNPQELIYKDGEIVGYTEEYIEEDSFSPNSLLNSLDDIYNDITLLSRNGFVIQDLYYNYVSNEKKFKFIDMTSYKYYKTNNEFLLNKILRDNINTVNIFIIGILYFDAFRKGAKNERTKILEAVMFNEEKCKDVFCGDYIRKSKIKGK